jgi:hypothetical protein
MLKLTSLGVVIALATAAPLGATADAAAYGAKKHVSYAEAYKRCKVHVDKLAYDQQSARYSRGAACMHQYGYKL